MATQEVTSWSVGREPVTAQRYRRGVMELAVTWLFVATPSALWDDFLGTSLVLPSWSLYLAVGVNSLSGAAYAARRGFDLVGVLGMAIIQGLGGLLALSILLQLGLPFVLTDPWYIVVALVTGLIGFFFAASISQALRLALVLDALAMGLFVTVGVGQSLLVALNPLSAVFVGVITATGGLILRDIMAGVAPSILRPGVFVGVVALAGSALMVVLVEYVGMGISLAQVITVLFVGVVRTLAVVRDWRTSQASELSERVSRYWR